jgi:hypothetical protein
MFDGSCELGEEKSRNRSLTAVPLTLPSPPRRGRGILTESSVVKGTILLKDDLESLSPIGGEGRRSS